MRSGAADRDEEMLAARSAVIYHEGMDLDGLVIGARGKLTLIYVDAKLKAGIMQQGAATDKNTPDEQMKLVANYASHAGGRKGMTLMLAVVETFKSWRFDTADVSIGGWSPSPDDVIAGLAGTSRSEIKPGTNELPKEWRGLYAFYVPDDRLPRGEEISIRLGESEKKWRVPNK